MSPLCTGMVDSLVFRFEHFHAYDVCRVSGGTRGAIIVVTVAVDVQFGFPPNDLSFRLLWRRSSVLRLRPVRVCPIVVVRFVLRIIVVLAGVVALTLR